MKPALKAFLLMGIIAVAYLSFTMAGGTTLRGDTLSYSGIGTLEGIGTIDLLDQPLLITDSEKSTIVAVFNADPLVPVIIAQDLILNLTFPNTTTSFIGNVFNIDNINGFSRFSENNLNNGTSASAGFNAVNDAGVVVNFGIGSSNFMIGNESLPNQGAIASFSPTGFDFVNSLTGDWRWRNNPTGNLSIPIRETVMTLSNFGNLDIAGNFTGNQFYGEMSGFHILSPELISITSLAIINSSGIFNFFKITNWTAGENNGFTFFNDTLIVQNAGLYNVKFGVTYSNSAQGKHAIMVAKNGEAIVKTAGAGYVSNANDVRTITGVGFIRVEQGDILEIVVGDRFAPVTNIEVLSSSFDLVRIGE